MFTPSLSRKWRMSNRTPSILNVSNDDEELIQNLLDNLVKAQEELDLMYEQLQDKIHQLNRSSSLPQPPSLPRTPRLRSPSVVIRNEPLGDLSSASRSTIPWRNPFHFSPSSSHEYSFTSSLKPSVTGSNPRSILIVRIESPK